MGVDIMGGARFER